MDDLADLEEQPSETGFTEADLSEMVRVLRVSTPAWKPPLKPLGTSPKNWTPSLRTGKHALHLHTVPTLRRAWIDRMELARSAGFQITVAAPEEMWRVASTLLEVDRIGGKVSVLEAKGDSGGWDVKHYASVVRMMLSKKVLLDSPTRSQLGVRLFERALGAERNTDKGRLFEEFLAFLFAQIPYLEFYSSNYVNATEEIDVVLWNRQTASGALPRAPLILVSGKNVREAVGVPSLTSLDGKIRNRRGQCHLGILCCSRRFASTVKDHSLRGSRENHVIATIDGDGLLELLRASDIGRRLEEITTQAALS